MTPFALLLQLSGLSQREAAGFLSVSPASIDKWSRGTRTTPGAVLVEMQRLISRQQAAAAEDLALMASIDSHRCQIGYPADDHEAQALGWPCVGAWRGMAARVVAGTPDASSLMLTPHSSN